MKRLVLVIGLMMMLSGCLTAQVVPVPAALTVPMQPPVARQGMDLPQYLAAWNAVIDVCNAKLKAIEVYSGKP